MVIGKIKTLTNLIKLGEMEFDFILGMDWLFAYRAHVDYCEKRIIFGMEGISKFIFEGIKDKHIVPIISALRATKLIRQWCQGFLASVLDTQRAGMKIENILMMSEYPNVFPKDLPSLSLYKEVKFAIDILPGTTPISKAP